MLRNLFAAAVALVPLLVPGLARAKPAITKVKAGTVIVHKGTVDDGTPPKASKEHEKTVAPKKPKTPPSASVGSPSSGKLENGVRFEDEPAARFTPSYGTSDVRYGTSEIVALVHGAAKSVAKQYPGSVLNVGQFSKPGGGDVDRHASHESGRDVDLPFYIKDGSGKPYLAGGFVPFRSDGTTTLYKGLHFDDARNWALVAALLRSPHAHVSHIFVADPQRNAVLAYGKAHGADPDLLAHAAGLMVQPTGVLPHDDHFHVRIACPSGDGKCVENPAPSRRAKKHPKAKGGKTGKAHGGSGATHTAGKGVTKVATKAPAKPVEAEETTTEESSAEDPLEKLLSPQVEGLGSIHMGAKRD